MVKKRYLEQEIDNIAFTSGKMAFVSGPRQCGKTTMAKSMLKNAGEGHYYNWDETKFRRLWTKDPSQVVIESYENAIPMIVLDEIHKAKFWKRSLKGIYDTLKVVNNFLITGSARLNTYRKGSDSLMGRYYHFLLHPFSVAELLKISPVLPDQLLNKLFSEKHIRRKNAGKYLKLLDQFGPFPEPLLSAKKSTLNLWRKNRIEKLVREDLRDLSRIPELSQIEMLVSLLPEKVASMLSIQSLSEDLEVAYTTIKRWLNYLQSLYYHYEIKSYSKSVKRSIKKMSKIYLWDWSEVEDNAARFENLVASHLLKYCHYLTDTGHGSFELKFLRSKDQKEIDFLLVKNNKPWIPIEVKVNSDKPSVNWRYFLPLLKLDKGIQVIQQPGVHKIILTEYGEILIISAEIFLSYLI